MWPAGRTLRGSRHTAQLTLAALVFSSLAALCTPAQAQVSSASSEGWSRRLASSHYQRATELEQRGDVAQALREYSATIAIDSTLGDAYLRLGALRERMGDTREAELIYSEAIRLGDSRAQALIQRRIKRRVVVLAVDVRCREDRRQRLLSAQVEAAARRQRQHQTHEDEAAHHTTTFTSLPGT